MNRNIDELRTLMSISANASESKIMEAFDSIADYLKNYCVIKAKEKDGEYRILDFEFYFFNKNHQDITTHPRNSEALCWYINDFGGIDLNFESKVEVNNEPMVKKGFKTYSCRYKLSSDSYFGGILIRQIQRLSDKVIFDGPLKVAELFRTFNASHQLQDIPILIIAPELLEKLEFASPQRHNILGSHKDITKKVDYNLQSCFEKVEDSRKENLINSLQKILDKESKNHSYRYCWAGLKAK
jgi:hypothetical protein